MSEKRDGGPAFPRPPGNELAAECNCTHSEGMTLRDWFAGTLDVVNLGPVRNSVFAELLMGKSPDYEEDPEAYLAWFVRFEAKIRYAKAAAMLIEREKT